jgi:hypothetical protein
MFMSKNPKPQLTLADILREKITEKHTEIQTQFSDNGSKWYYRPSLLKEKYFCLHLDSA